MAKSKEKEHFRIKNTAEALGILKEFFKDLIKAAATQVWDYLTRIYNKVISAPITIKAANLIFTPIFRATLVLYPYIFYLFRSYSVLRPEKKRLARRRWVWICICL